MFENLLQTVGLFAAVSLVAIACAWFVKRRDGVVAVISGILLILLFAVLLAVGSGLLILWFWLSSLVNDYWGTIPSMVVLFSPIAVMFYFAALDDTQGDHKEAIELVALVAFGSSALAGVLWLLNNIWT